MLLANIQKIFIMFIELSSIKAALLMFGIRNRPLSMKTSFVYQRFHCMSIICWSIWSNGLKKLLKPNPHTNALKHRQDHSVAFLHIICSSFLLIHVLVIPVSDFIMYISVHSALLVSWQWYWTNINVTLCGFVQYVRVCVTCLAWWMEHFFCLLCKDGTFLPVPCVLYFLV